MGVRGNMNFFLLLHEFLSSVTKPSQYKLSTSMVFFCLDLMRSLICTSFILLKALNLNQKILLSKQKNCQRGSGKISTEGSGNVHGGSGLQKSVTQGKGCKFGLELLTLLKKLLELMIWRHGGSGEKKQKWIFLMNFLKLIRSSLLRQTLKTYRPSKTQSLPNPAWTRISILRTNPILTITVL